MPPGNDVIKIYESFIPIEYINTNKVTWMLVTALSCIKHVHVVITNDWTSQEARNASHVRRHY